MAVNKVLVTGGIGYIGSHTVQHLLEKGYAVIVVDNLSYSVRQNLLHTDAEIIVGNLEDEQLLGRIFEYNDDIDAVLHLAGSPYYTSHLTSTEINYQKSVLATLKLLQIMIRKGCQKLLFGSTAAVYGHPKITPIDEKHSLNPNTIYGRSMAMTELMIQDFAKSYGIQYCILRYFNVIGCAESMRHAHYKSITDSFLYKELWQLKLYASQLTKPTQTHLMPNAYDDVDIDIVSVQDVALANVLALEHLFIDNHSNIYNIGSGRKTTPNKLIQNARDIFQIQPSGLLTNPDLMYFYKGISDSNAAADMFGWNAHAIDPYIEIKNMAETI